MVDLMTTSLPLIKTTRKTGAEKFLLNGKPLDLTLLDFWQWSTSDLLDNTNRGIIAEFIVANDLGITDKVTDDWGPYDLLFNDIKIEVKSAAYVQAWNQKEYSHISFGIAPRRAWDPMTNHLSKVSKRQSDVYVFCVLKHKDKETINPLDIDQWEIYILPTKILDEKIPGQKTITLASLMRFEPMKVEYGEIKKSILEMINL